jgi:hypothetical protein
MARGLRRQTLSMRGEVVDFGSLSQSNSEQITLGNTRTNVRGDQLGDGGVVLKTQEQIEAEWARRTASRQAAAADIKADMARPAARPAPPVSDIDFPSVSDLVSQGVIPTATPKRKIVDSD